MRENAVRLQELQHIQLQERDAALKKEAKLQEVQATLTAYQERVDLAEDRLDVEVLLHSDTKTQLDGMSRRNEVLSTERDTYRKKHCGSEAALRGLHMRFEGLKQSMGAWVGSISIAVTVVSLNDLHL